MPSNRIASDVTSRFRNEVEYIERYIHLLRAKSTLHDHQVSGLNDILEAVGIDPLPTRHFDRIGKPYSLDELTELLNSIVSVNPEVYQTILGYEQRLNGIPSFLMNTPAADYMDQLGEFVEYLFDRLTDDPDEYEIENVIRQAIDEYETVNRDLEEEDRIPPDALSPLVAIAADHAVHTKIRRHVDAMVYAREQFDEIEVLVRMATPDAEINLLRQGFILLMTAFDAAVFDLTRIGLRQRFFDLIGAFGKQDKFTLEDLSDAENFDTFQDRMIEEQLKKRYVKELLSLLISHRVQCVDDSVGDRPVQLIELILRRNLHVHNRGVVDERYLEPAPGSKKPKYNLFNLKLGDVAVISDDYFQAAIRLCSNCTERLARWADNR